MPAFGPVQGTCHQRPFHVKPAQWFSYRLTFWTLPWASVTKQNESISTQGRYAGNSFTSSSPAEVWFLFPSFLPPPRVTHHIEDLEIPDMPGEGPSAFWLDWTPPQPQPATAAPGPGSSGMFQVALMCSYLKHLKTFSFAGNSLMPC